MDERKYFAFLSFEGTLFSDRHEIVEIEKVIENDKEALMNCTSFTVQEGLKQQNGSLNYTQVSPKIYVGEISYESYGYGNSFSKDGRLVRVVKCDNGARFPIENNEIAIALGDNTCANLLSGIIGMQYTQKYSK